MTRSTSNPTHYRALLIGVDAYPDAPLHGCVNDIDAVQRILLERLAMPPDRICRLVSPHAGASHATEVPARPATLANMRAAFVELAAQTAEHDRVLIYFSGHGLRVPCERPDRHTFYREALVPFDVGAAETPSLLFDYELNSLLGDLTTRTRSITLVLDCCHSAGATRSPGQSRLTARTFDPSRLRGLEKPLRETAELARRGDGMARTVEDCHVVTACLNHELAQETVDDRGRTHGLLTSALVRALDAIDDAELPSVPWSRIWQAMREDVEGLNPWQHLWMAGSQARAVLAGPPVDRDPGFEIRRAGDRYEIGAGTLAGVTDTAHVAVYGETPAYFPPVDSPEDHAARRGLLRVESATASSAIAAAVGHIELLAGARGRLVKPGAPERLKCAVMPPDPELVEALGRSPLLEVVDREHARVWLEQVGDQWLLTDDVHEEVLGSALFALTAAQRHRARFLLEHYVRYALPLRMAESVRELPGALQLRVLACPERLSPAAAQAAELDELDEAPTHGTSVYDLRTGARVCFRVENKSRALLRVTLLNSAASGRVQLLGDQVIDGRSAYVFWAGSEIGTPFEMTVPAGKNLGIDRLTAIGTTALNKDLSFLRVDTRFLELMRDVGVKGSPAEKWTATQAIVKTRAR